MLTTRLIILVEAILTTITFVDGLDIAAKVTSAITALVVGFFAVRHYILQRKLTNLQIEKLKHEHKK
jgi:hypothetical protein